MPQRRLRTSSIPSMAGEEPLISASDFFRSQYMTTEELAEQQKKTDKKLQAIMLGGSRAQEAYRAELFQTSEKTRLALEAVVAFNSQVDNLYFCGPTGSGKSHLAASAARKLLRYPDWRNSIFTTSQMDISRRLRCQKDSQGEEVFIAHCANIEVLVLEDLGVAKDTEFLLSAIYEIINRRYQDLRGGLIVTSNLTLGQLAQKFNDERISSRLAQMCERKIFNFSGEKDRRLPG